MMTQKTISGRDLSKTLTSEDLLGKEVIDIDSRFIGVVEKVLIDPRDLEFVGISVDKGFLRKGFTVGKSYIDKIEEHAVFLNIKVSFDLKGMIVFDKDGAILGKVSTVELEGTKNDLLNIVVRPPFFELLFRKEFRVAASYIDTIGENVMLKVEKNKLGI